MSRAKASVVPSMKSKSAPKTAHTSNSKKGMGDYYGTGVKNPTGKMREGMGVNPLGKKSLGKAPKSLA
jgi:hypothetical protein